MPDPDSDALLQQALTHHRAGRLALAEADYRLWLADHPDDPEALHMLGLALLQQRCAVDAVPFLRQSLTLRPRHLPALNNLGSALASLGRLEEALALFQQAVDRQPDYVAGWSNLGSMHFQAGHYDAAVAAYSHALTLSPNLPELHANRARAQLDAGRTDQAIAGYRRALELRPQSPGLHRDLAFALLLRGDYLEGWRHYEWRWRLPDFSPAPHAWREPRWDGRPAPAQTLLLHAEQGLGDTLQFIRFAAMAASRVGRVLIACPPAAMRLAQTAAGVAEVIGQGAALPSFDLQLPLASLPFLFNTTVETLPRSTPYLHADPADVLRWKQRLTQLGTGTTIGLAWGGNPANSRNRQRSLPLSALAPLAQRPGLHLVSLQKGPAAAQAAPFPLIDWTDELHDLADTAALMAALDLVISVDTVVAHLAGALARPAWVLLSYAPDWRWMLHRSDSPWYPSMRLFRQPAYGDWPGAVRQLLEALP